jgi:hypothetical protein
MYDHNQTLLPDSFLALHVRNGRAVIGRDELEARYEIAETIALRIAEVLVHVPGDDDRARREALQAVQESLLTPPAEVSEAEATWVIARVREICEWEQPPQ